ncbi:hypothetical protein BN871_JH_00120, partial [Paenibacillus sp. P22]
PPSCPLPSCRPSAPRPPFVRPDSRGRSILSQFGQFVEAWNAAGGTEITKYANKTIK